MCCFVILQVHRFLPLRSVSMFGFPVRQLFVKPAVRTPESDSRLRTAASHLDSETAMRAFKYVVGPAGASILTRRAISVCAASIFPRVISRSASCYVRSIESVCCASALRNRCSARSNRSFTSRVAPIAPTVEISWDHLKSRLPVVPGP